MKATEFHTDHRCRHCEETGMAIWRTRKTIRALQSRRSRALRTTSRLSAGDAWIDTREACANAIDDLKVDLHQLRVSQARHMGGEDVL